MSSNSYAQLDKRDGKKPDIAMPPLPAEFLETPVVEVRVQSTPEPEHIEEEVVQDEPDIQESSDDQFESTARPNNIKENFRQIREAKEKAERDALRSRQERDALMSQMLEMQAKRNNQSVDRVVEEPDEMDLDIDAETLVEGKHLKKYVDQMKEMKKELKSYKSQSQQLVTQNKLKSEYPDFDMVFNAKTVTILNEDHPGIARALSNIPNDYDKAVAAYEMIKNLGITENLMKKAVVSSDRERALKNVVKPRTVTSVSPQQGDSPLSKANAFANGLTEDLKEQLRKEMAQARKAS